MEEKVRTIIFELFGVQQEVVLTRPDAQFGDYATNVALQLAGKLGKNPKEIAETIAAKLKESRAFAEVNVAGPGFINIRLSAEEIFRAALHTSIESPVKRILLEYSCPNPFKEIHTGHMYQTFLGDALGRMYEHAGTEVYRANFGGDVGLHVGKAMWGLIQELGGEHPEKLEGIAEDGRSLWLGKAYVAGSRAYEEDEAAKLEIMALNKKVYQLHANSDTTSNFARIYWICREWSYDYFKAFYAKINAEPFNKFYPESTTSMLGLELVEGNIGDVFKESNEAIILPEEISGLHTRVFVTSQGLPTYETKDLGVIQLETQDFSYDKRIIMTGNDQSEYMKVVFAALKLIDPELGAKQMHIANGTVRFGDGKKMSSRLGNVARAVDVLNVASEAVQAHDEKTRQQIALGALKYSLLKNRIGGDIAFDLEQSVSLEGNSGPYLQYAAVRAASILTKATTEEVIKTANELDEYERALAWQLGQWGETITQSLADSSPHHVCSYLYALSQSFNRFYEHSRVIGDEREVLRMTLVRRYHKVLKEGLGLLGIEVPEKM
ncbi:MAG TPA: arginine--tRNA ligase [Candidatus Saccharimonadales bacterium]|nr:arginine--tRNA ligase [Candidatus Saccharimonadales bacterium]